MDKMQEYSRHQHGYYFYAHSKSAANAHQFNQCWMYTMEFYNLLNWTEAVFHLKSNDAVGCFWLTHDLYPNLIHWEDTKPDTNSFFAGNYWLTCPDIFEPVGFRDNGSSHLRSSDEASEVYGRADRSNIARGG